MHKTALFVVIAAEICVVFTLLGFYWASVLRSSPLPWLILVVALFTLLETMLPWSGKARVKKSLGRTVTEWALAAGILVYVYLRHLG